MNKENRLICEQCDVQITKWNFWAKKHRGHGYVWHSKNNNGCRRMRRKEPSKIGDFSC